MNSCQISSSVWISLDPSLNDTLGNVKDEGSKKSGEKNGVVETLRKEKREGEKTIRLFCYYFVMRDEFAMTQVRMGLYGQNGALKRFQGEFGEETDKYFGKCNSSKWMAGIAIECGSRVNGGNR